MGSWSSNQSALHGFYAETALIHNNCRIKRNNFTTVASDDVSFSTLFQKLFFIGIKIDTLWNSVETETLIKINNFVIKNLRANLNEK